MNDNILERRFTSLPIVDWVHPDTKIGKNVRIGQSIIDAGCEIGDDVFIGDFCKIRNNVKIGAGSIIGHLVMIESDTIIGRKTTIQSQCHITKMATIGDRVFFGPTAVLINTHRISHGRNFEPVLKGPTICDGCRIATGAIIMPGIFVGKNSVVGAGSLLTKDVGEAEIWFGNPAKLRGKVPESEWL